MKKQVRHITYHRCWCGESHVDDYVPSLDEMVSFLASKIKKSFNTGKKSGIKSALHNLEAFDPDAYNYLLCRSFSYGVAFTCLLVILFN